MQSGGSMSVSNNDRQKQFTKKMKKDGKVKLSVWIYPEYKDKAMACVKELNESTIRPCMDDEDIEFI